jgi:hypothetical protein
MVKSDGVINIYLPKNNTILITIISIFIAFVTVLYLKPEFFVFAFHTILGNLIIACGLIGIGFLDKYLGVGLGLLLLIIYLSSKLDSKSNSDGKKGQGQGQGQQGEEQGEQGGKKQVKEAFNNPDWPQQIIDDFKKFQESRNPNVQYDIKIIQKQATLDEVNQLFETGKWPWSEQIRQLYLKSIANSSNISIDPGNALSDAQSIYNENAIKEVLAWGSKEGVFLIHGATIGHPKGMPENINNMVRCGTAKDGSNVMQKIEYLGYNGLNGSMDKNVVELKNAEIPKEVAGFSFIKSECNPCVALNDVPDYSCPFSINTGNGTEISDIWKNLWGLSGDSENTSTKKNDFPILSKLRDELNKASSEDIHFYDNEQLQNSDYYNQNQTNEVIDNSQDALLNSDNTQEIGEDSWVPSLEGGRGV